MLPLRGGVAVVGLLGTSSGFVLFSRRRDLTLEVILPAGFAALGSVFFLNFNSGPSSPSKNSL